MTKTLKLMKTKKKKTSKVISPSLGLQYVGQTGTNVQLAPPAPLALHAPVHGPPHSAHQSFDLLPFCLGGEGDLEIEGDLDLEGDLEEDLERDLEGDRDLDLDLDLDLDFDLQLSRSRELDLDSWGLA